jgi:ATP synthase alpha/beta family, beta-barrel domain
MNRRNRSVHAEPISSVIREEIGVGLLLDTAEVGTVVSIGDGIARVSGVERAMLGEMLGFPNGVFGIALNLEEDCVGVVLLGASKHIKEGDLCAGPLGSSPGTGCWGGSSMRSASRTGLAFSCLSTKRCCVWPVQEVDEWISKSCSKACPKHGWRARSDARSARCAGTPRAPGRGV